MEELNRISAEELFGASSRVVECGDVVAQTGIASLGSAYQIVTALVAMLLLFIVIRYLDLFRYLLLSLVSKSVKRDDIGTFASDIRNAEIFTSFAGFTLLALFVMRLMVMPLGQSLFAHFGGVSAWSVALMVFASSIAVVMFERGLLYIIGVVSECGGACNDIWHIKLLHFTTTIITISPLLILVLLSEGTVAQIALYSSIAICSLSLILFVKETFLLFRAQRFSIFHWILYLCALEIFPLSLVIAPIARGGV